MHGRKHASDIHWLSNDSDEVSDDDGDAAATDDDDDEDDDASCSSVGNLSHLRVQFHSVLHRL